MKVWRAVIVILLAVCFALRASASAPPAISAQSAILVDSETNQVLFEKNADAKRAPASTTKLMTAILLVENCRLDEKVKAPKGVEQIPSSSLHLKPGEQLNVHDLLHAILLRSANDAAVVAGKQVAGSVPAFVKMMNKRAAEMGATNTHFVNPNGLNAEGHYSTARDLALIGKRAIHFPIINRVVGKRSCTISRSMDREDVYLRNRSHFLRRYPGADGIKTGYTREAGQCLVASATRDGWRLVAVVLKSDNNADDAAALMNYGFANFERKIIARKNSVVEQARVRGGKQRTVGVAPATDVYAVVPKSSSGDVKTKIEIGKVAAPLASGSRVGKINTFLDGRVVQKTQLLAAKNVDKSLVASAWPWVRNGALLLALGMVVGRKYGAATTKGSRRRRRRFQTSVRGTYRRW